MPLLILQTNGLQKLIKHYFLQTINTPIEINVLSLKLYELISKGYYKRSIDPLASTEFTYTRFLVPALTNFNGWAIFCDCDFIFFRDRF